MIYLRKIQVANIVFKSEISVINMRSQTETEYNNYAIIIKDFNISFIITLHFKITSNLSKYINSQFKGSL